MTFRHPMDLQVLILAAVKGTNDTGRVADNDGGGWDVVNDDAARADHASVSDRHSGQDDRAASNPDIIADADRTSIFQTGSSYIRLKRMLGGI